MRRDPMRCPHCKRRSERVALGQSCFHCGRTASKHIQVETIWAIVVAVALVALGAQIARWLA